MIVPGDNGKNPDDVLAETRERMGKMAPSAVPDAQPQAPDQYATSTPMVGAPRYNTTPGPLATVEDQLDDNVKMALASVADVNPDKEAATYNKAVEAGVDPRVAAFAPEALEQRLATLRTQMLDLSRTSPRVAQAITAQREFAGITKDDLAQQQQVEWDMNRIASAEHGPLSFWPDLNYAYMQLKGAWASGVAIPDSGQAAFRENLLRDEPNLSESTRRDYIQSQMAPPTDEDGLFMGNLKYLTTQAGQWYANKVLYFSMTVGGAAAGTAIYESPVGTAKGATVGFLTASFMDGFGTEAGHAYIEYRMDGMSHESARKAALAHGLVSGTIESFSNSIMFRPVALAFKAVFKTGVREAIRKQTKAAIARAGLYQVGATWASNAAEEALQRASALAFKELGKRWDDPTYQSQFSTPEGARLMAQEVVDEFSFSFRNGLLMSMIFPSVNTLVRFDAHSRNRQQLDGLNGLIEKAGDSTTNQRSRPLYRQFLSLITGGTMAEYVYIDAEELAQSMKQAGIKPEMLNDIIPGLGDQYRDAPSNPGAPLRIATADYITRIYNTPLDAAMRANLRVKPGGESMNQVLAMAPMADAWVEQSQKMIDQFEKVESTRRAEADTVAQRIEQDIAQSENPLTEDERGWVGFMYSRSVLAMAEEAGMTVEEFEKQFGLKIREKYVAQAPQAVASLAQQQLAKADADYLSAVNRGDIKATQRTADAAANAAGMQRATRYTVGNKGLLNAQALDYDKLTDEEMAEVETLLPLGLEQPTGVPAGSVFYFTEQGLVKHARLIELLKKAARGRVVETTQYVPVQAAWTSRDGQVAIAPGQAVSADPVVRDASGNVVPLSQRFKLTSADIFEQALSTRVPTAKGMELAALEEMLLADLDAMMKSDRMVEGNLRIAEELGVPVKIDRTLPKEQQVQQLVQFMVDNLLALHDKMDPQQRERAKLWYVGGRRIVDDMAARYGITDMQAAAMLAVLSPQKNWFENVSMAFRIGDILSAQREATWNEAVDKSFRKEVADIKASVPIAEARLAQAVKDAPRRTRQRTAESDEKFAKRAAEWERTKERKVKQYAVDLAAWEADLARLDEQIGEAAENGESTAELRAERAAINRSRPNRPRAPVQVTAETDAEYEARKAQFPVDKKKHDDRVAKLTKAVASRKNAVKRMEALERSQAVKDLRAGQTLGQLLETKNLDIAARFVRYLDETGNSREFAIITPEGGMAGPSQGKDGPLTMRWGSYATIAKAISVYEDGRVENVHHQIGMAHKVRNFYNNLFDPTNPNAGTIDTHAIAAALLQALGSSSDLVSWGLGAGVSDTRLGLHGGYPLVYEAYRQAAQQRGLLVREMQSITWEAVRGLFEAAMKKTLAEPVAAIWQRYKDGEISIEEAREAIFTLAGGIKDPEWVTQPTDLPVTSTYTGASDAAMQQARAAAPRATDTATVSFEVAPDPRDVTLVAQWKSLSAARRQEISMSVASTMVPQVLAEYGVSAQVSMQMGGWKGDSNVSFAITMPAGPLVRQVGMALGWVLSQEAVYSFSETKYTGADRTTMVVIKLADGISPADIADLYETKLHGTGIMGHSTSGSVMYIAVDSKSGLDAGELANTIATATDTDPRVESVVTLEGWSKQDDVQEQPTTEVERAGAEPTRLVPPSAQRRRLDLWRAEATRLVAEQSAQQADVAGGAGGYAVEPAAAGRIPPLDGAPSAQGIQGPDPRIVATARRYAASIGLPFRRQSEYARVDEERAKRISDAYEAMQNNPNDPDVRAAYEDLVRQTKAQYEALVAAGYRFYFFDPENDPYADQPGGFGNPWNAVRDLRENQTMAVFPTDVGYGTDLSASDYDASQNPLLAPTGIMWPYGSLDGEMREVRANDLFRAVHDAFGHSLEGAGFRARGEENAWQAHVRLFHGPAVGAMTSETRGQNSWLNYGPHGAKNRDAKVEDTVFAEQKVGLMPAWTWDEGRVAEVDYPVAEEGAFNQEMVPPRFYSALETSVADVKANAMTPDSWMQQIRGLINKGIVKADEVEWSGLEEFLEMTRDGGKVTRDELLNFLRTNGIKVTVVETRSPDVAPGAAQFPLGEERARARLAAVDIARDALREDLLLTDELNAALDAYARAVSDGAPRDVLDSLAEPVDAVLDEQYGASLEAYALDNMETGAEQLGAYVPDDTKYRKWSLPGGTEYREIRLTIPVATPRLNRSENLSVADAPEMYEYTIDGVAPSIYSAHVTAMPDGMYEVIKFGYRTAFSTLDQADAYIRKTLADDSQGFSDRTSFKTTHWEERNIVVHLRLTTRIDADGKRVLFVEEIQSDWGQQGRANGFRDRVKLAALRKRVRELEDRQKQLSTAVYDKELSGIYVVHDAIDAAIKEGAKGERGAATEFMAMSDNDLAAKYSLDARNIAMLREWSQWVLISRDLTAARVELMRMNEAIPSGPFVENTDSWTTLGLKQILIEAVKGKYDRVAFVTGDQTVQHYRDALVTAVDGVQIVRETDGTYSVNAFKDEDTLVEETNIRRERIAELFGKAGADQLVSAADAAGDGVTVEVDSGNLEVGGAGLRKHYGQIVPKNLQKLLKKFGGGQIGETQLPAVAMPMPEVADEVEFFDEGKARAVLERGGTLTLSRSRADGRPSVDVNVSDVNALDQAMLDYNDFDYMKVVEAGTQPSTTQMSFDVTPELVNGLSGGIPLFQSTPGPARRGSYDVRRRMMTLTSASDVSTFLHEMAHHHLTVMSAVAASAGATPEMKARMDSVLRWFGIAGATAEERLANWNAMTLEQQRPYHEQFAYNFEIYMFEGRAPSLEMQSAFEFFARMLRKVYTAIKTELNEIYRANFGRDLPVLNSEVRQVFDTFFASADEIARAQAVRNMVPLYFSEEEAMQAGMSAEDWADYQAGAKLAMQESVSELQKRSLGAMQWLGNARSRVLRRMQAEHNALRAKMRGEVEDEVRKRAVYRAMSYLRTGNTTNPDGTAVKAIGPHRLDIETVEAMYPAGTANRPDIERLGTGGRGMMGLDGQHPDLVAEIFGYESGDQMIRALLDAKPIDDEIDAVTDRRMLETYGDMTTAKAREDAVEKALHNEARARFLVVQHKFESKAKEPVRVMLAAAKQAAATVLGLRRIRDIRPGEFSAAEARAAKDAEMAHNKRRTPEQVAQAAYTRVYGELLSAVAAGAMTETDAKAMAAAAQEQARAETAARDAEYAARYGTTSPDEVVVNATRRQVMQNQLATQAAEALDEVRKAVKYLRNVLSDENRKRMGADAADQIEKILERFELRPKSLRATDTRARLADWINSQMELGIDLEIPDVVLNEILAISYRDMTLQDFRDMVESVELIEAIGKGERAQLLAAKRETFEAMRDEIVTNIENEADLRGRRVVAEEGRDARTRLYERTGKFVAMHTKAAIIAQILDGRDDGGPLWEYLIRTANEAGDREAEMLAKATEDITRILLPVTRDKGMGGKGMHFPSVNMNLNREARIVIALNWGNESNRQRLLDGPGWNETQVMPILESLTEAEWLVVQELWDYFESYRPMIAEKERRIKGKEPKWIEPTPFTVRTADGKVITLRGGYYPIKYDKRASAVGRRIDLLDKATMDMKAANINATTRQSYTKARAEKVTGSPLKYTLAGLYAGIDEVIHDLTHHEWVIDANRLMRDRAFQTAVRTRLGPSAFEQLEGWIKRVASGNRGISQDIDAVATAVRGNVAAAGLGYQLVNGALQLTGMISTVVKLGYKYTGEGLRLYTLDMLGSHKRVQAESSFMRNRSRTQFRELNEVRNVVRGQSTITRRVALGTFMLITRVQSVVDTITWLGAESKALAEGNDEARARALADQAVIDTQGSGMIKDLASVEAGGPMLKLFTVFYGFMNTSFNLGALRAMNERSKMRKAHDLVMLSMGTVAITRLIRSMLQPNEDDEDFDMEALAKQLAVEQIEYMMGMFVFLRELAFIGRIALDAKGPRGYQGPAGLRLFTDVAKFAEQLSQWEFDTPFRKAAVNLLGDTLGIPSVQINRTWDGIEAISEGKVEGPLDIPRAILFGVEK